MVKIVGNSTVTYMYLLIQNIHDIHTHSLITIEIYFRKISPKLNSLKYYI